MGLLLSSLVFLVLPGCQTTSGQAALEQAKLVTEPQWIREGRPLEFEGEYWFPLDVIENLLDSEVYFVGRYEDEEFYVDRADVRPYNRLYTRFGKNKYRAFEKK